MCSWVGLPEVNDFVGGGPLGPGIAGCDVAVSKQRLRLLRLTGEVELVGAAVHGEL
nr:hypothetical protein [Tanacetum cinerariifolium]